MASQATIIAGNTTTNNGPITKLTDLDFDTYMEVHHWVQVQLRHVTTVRMISITKGYVKQSASLYCYVPALFDPLSQPAPNKMGLNKTTMSLLMYKEYILIYYNVLTS